MDSAKHLWIHAERGPLRAPGQAQDRDLRWLLPPVNAHRRLRGPYTAAGTILRALVPDALGCTPERVAAHEIEILTGAPELQQIVPSTRETLTSLAVPNERTRYYSPLRTLRLAHGLAEFLRDYVRAAGPSGASLLLDRVDQADPTDQELIAVLLRRVDPALITITVRSGPALAQDGPLATALATFAERVLPGASAAGDADRGHDAGRPRELAAAYVAADGTADDPDLLAAYQSMPLADRQRLHDHRAAELEASGEFSWRLGAIPYHAERGSDAAGRAREALAQAADHCSVIGFYHAAADLGSRGLALTSCAADPNRWWAFTSTTATALAALGRTEDAEKLYLQARACTTDALVHMQISYGMAMLYTRMHEPERIDHGCALGWINQSIALASQLPDAKERAIQMVFNQNGRALVEKHLGRPEEALRLVSVGLDRLEAVLDPSEHLLHRSVLRHNRGQVYAGLGRVEEATADFRAVIEADPNYPEYHFDLGNLLARLGDREAALAQYEITIQLSPPFPEIFYNRADTRAACGDLEGALADFAYVLELDPGHLDAHINRAGLLLQIGANQAADDALQAGQAIAPGNAHLLCLRGRLDLEAGRWEPAQRALDAAVTADPAVAETWATRATLAYQTGDLPGALADLSTALEIRTDATLLYNRALVHQKLGHWHEAIADLSAVLDLTPTEADAWLRRAVCRSRIQDLAGAGADARHFTALAPDRADEASTLVELCEAT